MDNLLKINDYMNEDELLKKLPYIQDYITFRRMSFQDVLLLVDNLLKLDILSFPYTTRELILYIIADAIGHYKIVSLVNLESLISIRANVEEDLKEYIDECISSGRANV